MGGNWRCKHAAVFIPCLTAWAELRPNFAERRFPCAERASAHGLIARNNQRTASSIIRDSSLAEDAVHETFVQLLKEIDSLRIDNEKSLQSYLYILTRERTIDFLRKWERRRGVLTDYENRSTSFDNFKEPEEIALTNLQLNKAVSILSDMPSIYRRTLVLRVKGYSIREIAQITNSSESNVKTRIHRARAILLKSFDT